MKYNVSLLILLLTTLGCGSSDPVTTADEEFVAQEMKDVEAFGAEMTKLTNDIELKEQEESEQEKKNAKR